LNYVTIIIIIIIIIVVVKILAPGVIETRVSAVLIAMTNSTIDKPQLLQETVHKMWINSQ